MAVTTTGQALRHGGVSCVEITYRAAWADEAMTTPEDTSMATLSEVRRLAAGRAARVIRKEAR